MCIDISQFQRRNMDIYPFIRSSAIEILPGNVVPYRLISNFWYVEVIIPCFIREITYCFGDPLFDSTN